MAPSSNAMPVRIALIDDDSGFVTVLERRFAALRWHRQQPGYAVGAEELAALRLHALVLNPALTGLDYLQRITTALPGLAVIVCSDPTTVSERVRGLRSGADDWITKPCHPEEMIARIQAVMRRRQGGGSAAEEETVSAGELAIRPDRFDAYVDGRAAGLSRKEYELLYQLAAAGGRVLERGLIYQRVWGYTMVRGDRSVDVFVRKLRHKLEAISPGWHYVHTHFGVGYRFSAEPAGDPGTGPPPEKVDPTSKFSAERSALPPAGEPAGLGAYA